MTPRNNRVGSEVGVRGSARSFVEALDNFYAPARDRRSEAAFQDGVNQLTGILGEQAAQIKQQERSDEHQQGVLDAMREEAGQELKGVQTGKLFRQHSKYYMMGLNETRGKAAAAKWKQQMTLAYENWEGRHVDDDGSLYRDWMNSNIADFMNTLGDDQFKVAGAMSVVNEVANNLAVQHTGFTASRLEQESFEAYSEVISGVFDDLHTGKYDNDDGSRDWDRMVSDLADEADDMYATDGAKANDHLVDAAIKYANIHNDPDAILALARAHDSGEIKISLANREKLANAMDAVEADIQRQTSKQNAMDSIADDERREETLNNWASTLQSDPFAQLPEFNEVGDHSTYRAMVSLQDSFISAAHVKAPQIAHLERMEFEADLHAQDSINDRLRLLAEFTQSNPNALSGSDVARYTQEIIETSNPASLVNNQLVSKFRDGFTRTLGEFQEGDEFDINRSSFLRTRGEIEFNYYLMSQAGKVDMNDPSAIRQVIKEAEEYAMEQLAFDYPDVLREKNEGSKLGGALGVSEALNKFDQAVAESAAEEFAQMLPNASRSASSSEKALPDSAIEPAMPTMPVLTVGQRRSLSRKGTTGDADLDRLVKQYEVDRQRFLNSIGPEPTPPNLTRSQRRKLQATGSTGDAALDAQLQQHQAALAEFEAISISVESLDEDAQDAAEAVDPEVVQEVSNAVTELVSGGDSRADENEEFVDEKEAGEDERDASVRGGFYGELLENFTDGEIVERHRGKSVTRTGNWIAYNYAASTVRNQKLSSKLTDALSFLPEMGIRMEVFSGGQPAKGTSDRRVGSTRHDGGMAADVFFYDESGRMISWENPEDIPTLQEIVRKAKANGITGIGAGPGYMRPGSFHIGFGTPAVWGAGGKGSNAPHWLREAFNGS